MTLSSDAQTPLQEVVEAAGGQSFDCEDGLSSSRQRSRKQIVSKLGQAVLLSVGLIFIMAVVGTPEMFETRVFRKFASFPFPSFQSPTAASKQHQGQIVQSPTDHLPDTSARSPAEVAAAPVIPRPLVPSVPGRAPAPEMMGQSTEQVCMLLSIIGLGKLLQNRFPNQEANVIQKLLLQFLFPASLFKGLSALTLKFSQLGYVAGGVFLVLVRLSTSFLASRAVMGSSSQLDRASLRRTATFQFATTSYALSVMPFISEFVGGDFVGLGSLVDLPMKFYMLIVMPVLLQLNCEEESCVASAGGAGKVVKKLLTDPISMSLILGLAAAALTGGQGCAALGFVGKAIQSLAGAQTAILFLLIGLKLKFDSASPLFSIVVLFAMQGLMLLVAALLCFAIPMSVAMQQFICFFAMGAPSVLGLGIITAAVDKDGVKGYNKDMAFDIIALACPISAIFQCIGGIFGPAYPSVAGFFGAGLLGIATILRVALRNKFKVSGGDKHGGLQPSTA